MPQIRLDQSSSLPIYLQIADQVRKYVATSDFKPGDQLPTVRELANSLNVNYNTVVRAYLELEKEHVIAARRRAGTIIVAGSGDPGIHLTRQKRLSDIVSEDILKVLSFGYRPEELEAAFDLHLARWQEERKALARSKFAIPKISQSSDTIRIVGSHDLALNLLVNMLKKQERGLEVELTYAGSLGGLIALQEERAHLAGIHLLDEETGEYNYPYVKRVLPGREIAIVHLAYRIQGLIFAAGNPKQVHGLADLQRRDIAFINRQKGSGTRVLLDLQLRHNGILSSEIRGYEREVDTHLAVASSIAKGEADAGLGIEASARSYRLGFLSLFRERYDLVIPMDYYRSRLLEPLLALIQSKGFRKVVDQVGGYDVSSAGTAMFL